jgi:hypothetical protein
LQLSATGNKLHYNIQYIFVLITDINILYRHRSKDFKAVIPLA